MVVIRKIASFVEVVVSRTTISRPMMQSPKAWRRCSASSDDMCKFQREIDGAGGMRKCAYGNVIDAGGGDTPHVFQCYAAARFEFQFVFAERDCFTNLRRLHVVEQDKIDIVYFQKRAHLLKSVGLNFNSHIRAFLAHATNRFRCRFQSSAGAQMIIFDQHHVVQTEAMILSASGHDRGFLQDAKPGRGLTRIENLRRMLTDRIHELASKRGDPGETLKKIQRDSFGLEDGPRQAANLHDDVTRIDVGAVAVNYINASGAVDAM